MFSLDMTGTLFANRHRLKNLLVQLHVQGVLPHLSEVINDLWAKKKFCIRSASVEFEKLRIGEIGLPDNAG